MNPHIVICLKCNTEQEYSFLCKKCGCTLGKNLRLVAQTTEQKKPSNEKLMFCASCDAEISKLAIICPKCDKPVVKQCNTCERKIAIDNMKCPECGAPEPFKNTGGILNINTEKTGILKSILFTIVILVAGALSAGILKDVIEGNGGIIVASFITGTTGYLILRVWLKAAGIW